MAFVEKMRGLGASEVCVTGSNLTLAVRFDLTALGPPMTQRVAMPLPAQPETMPFARYSEPREPALTEAQIEFMEMKRVLETAYAASGGTVTDADVWMALGKEPPVPKE